MARLFIIPAAAAPVAAILRRYSSRWYHVIRWDTQHDEFTPGAWIKGRIYEEKCDLSPDGVLLLSFVLQGSRYATEFTHAWTAVSRLPWLTALALWPQGTTYGGGGRFVGDRQVALRPLWFEPNLPTHPDFPARGLEVVEAPAELHRSAGVVADADWSGFDQRRRTIFTRGNCVYQLDRGSERMLADFTAMKPDPQPSPDWATRPLASE